MYFCGVFLRFVLSLRLMDLKVVVTDIPFVSVCMPTMLCVFCFWLAVSEGGLNFISSKADNSK